MTDPKRGVVPHLNAVPAHKTKDVLMRYFSRRIAARYRFGQLSELERTVLTQASTAVSGRLAYIKNPKCGCTTVMNLLYKLDTGHDYNGDVHRAPIGLRAGIERWPSLMEALRNAVSFSIVRHPERRFISAFFDFFVTQRNPEAPDHMKGMQALGFSRKDDLGYRFDVFLDYVEASLTLSAMKTDRHFRPQHINLGHGEFVLSHVGRLETLDADLQKVSEIAGIALPRTDSLSLSRQNRSGSQDFVPTAAQKRRTETLYARDYELYGY